MTAPMADARALPAQVSEPAPDAPFRGHIAPLDGVRGAAVLAVVLYHFGTVRCAPASWSERGAILATHAGWCGVDLFFVLSGLLITGILLDSRDAENRISSFYMRRFLRIFPLYYAVLLGYFVVVPAITGRPATGSGEQIWFWTYLCNWSTSLQPEDRAPMLTHFWSLAVEEQFYLVWPALVFHARRETLARICVAVAVAAPLVRIAVLRLGLPEMAAHRLTLCKVDALVLGGLAAIVLREPAWLRAVVPRLRAAAVVLGALLLGVWALSHGLDHDSFIVETAGLSLLALLFTILVLVVVVEASSGGPLARLFGNRALRWLGKYSYGIYVYNFILYVAVVDPVSAFVGAREGAMRTVLRFVFIAGGLLASAAVALASWRVLESPLLNLKRFFTVRRGATS